MKSSAAIAALSALAHESRLSLFRLLVRRGPQGYTPGELMERLELPAPTLSFHLKALAAAGLTTVRRDGRFLFYTASFDKMNQLVDFLTDQCCSMATTDCSDASCAPSNAGVSRRKSAA